MDPKDFFARWYKPAAAVAKVAPEQYGLRRQAVENFLGDVTKEQVLDLVRMFYGKPLLKEDSREALNAAIQKFDESYDTQDNNFDLQILSAICLSYLLKSSHEGTADEACLALITCKFNGLNDTSPKEAVSQDLLNIAEQYLKELRQRILLPT
jgi:hypothetical protein